FGSGTLVAANPHRSAKYRSCSCAKPRRSRIAPRPWSRTAFLASPVGISETLPAPMTSFRRPSTSITRRASDFTNRFAQDPHVSAEVFDAVALWVLGRVDEALRLADRALADAESVAHAPTMA